MKKAWILVLALVLSLGLVSCGNGQTGTASDTESKTSQADASSAAEFKGKEYPFTLFNGTEFDFTFVAISKLGKDDWSKNLITGTLTKQGGNAAVKISVPTDSEEMMFAMKAKDASGKTYLFQYLDLSELTDKGGNISLALTEGGDGFASFSPAE